MLATAVAVVRKNARIDDGVIENVGFAVVFGDGVTSRAMLARTPSWKGQVWFRL